MNGIWLYVLLCALAVSAVSFVGVFMLSMKGGVLRRVLPGLVSFAIGALAGNAFFHLLPEACHELSSVSAVMAIAAAGLGVFLLLDRFLHVHTGGCRPGEVKHYGYLSLYADGIHNFTDGILIAVAWMASPEVGVATTLAVVLHEVPQEVSDFGVLLQAGFARRKALLYNFYSGCTSVLGALLTLWLGEGVSRISIYVLPFAAGGFIYLAAFSLLPEVWRKATRRTVWWYVLCMLAGVLMMLAFSAGDGHVHG